MNESTTDRRSNTFTALMLVNISLVILLVLFGGAFVYFNTAEVGTGDGEMAQRYAEEAQERLSKHADEIEAELTSLASEALPPIRDAVMVRAKKDFPTYVQVLQRQGPEFLENLESIFMQEVKKQYRDYLATHRQVLQQEFPQHASEENVNRVLEEYQQVVDRLVERYYLDEFRRVSQVTQQRWAAFQPLPQPGPNEASLPEQLADYTSDWAVMMVSNSGQPIPAVEGSQ